MENLRNEEGSFYGTVHISQRRWKFSIYFNLHYRGGYFTPGDFIPEFFSNVNSLLQEGFWACTLNENERYGGFTFMIIPHIAWKLSEFENPNIDPWHETEANPSYVDFNITTKFYYPRYRIKSARPPLRCTQNGTYTYKGKTVNHVNKLADLPGLKLPPTIKETVFGGN